MEMKNKNTPVLLDMWVKASTEGKLRESLMYAITGYLNFVGTEEGDAFLPPIISSSRKLLEPYLDAIEQSAKEGMFCSFCGKGKPEVKLTAGPGTGKGAVFICNECSVLVAKIFKEQESAPLSTE